MMKTRLRFQASAMSRKVSTLAEFAMPVGSRPAPKIQAAEEAEGRAHQKLPDGVA